MAKAQTDTPKFGAVTPPPIVRGIQNRIPEEILASAVETLDGGEYASTGETFSHANPDKARQQANTAAMRYKKAVLNSPENSYDDPKSIRTRTWEVEEGVFTFCIYARDAGE